MLSPADLSAILERGEHFSEVIRHQVYAGDTTLHLAAAAHRPALISQLLGDGADVRVRNRRGAEPLHYAADGRTGSQPPDAGAQSATIAILVDAGADPNAVDKNGTSPLHRAVRNRRAEAVAALLERGADPNLPNGSGATALDLTRWNTGRGGSGSEIARKERAEIVSLLLAHGASGRAGNSGSDER